MVASVTVTNRKGFGLLTKTVDRASAIAIEETGAVAEGQVREQMTKARDPRGFVGRVQSGTTRQATQAGKVERTNLGLEVTVSTRPPQDVPAEVMERGRRKGKRGPPVRKILRWARLKLGPVKAESGRFKSGGRAKAEKARAFLIARAIGVRGIPALRPFRRAAIIMRKGLARRVFTRAFGRALKRGGGQ